MSHPPRLTIEGLNVALRIALCGILALHIRLCVGLVYDGVITGTDATWMVGSSLAALLGIGVTCLVHEHLLRRVERAARAT